MFYIYKITNLLNDKIYVSMGDVLQQNKNYKASRIYSAANGPKKSYMGYLGKKKRKENI